MTNPVEQFYNPSDIELLLSQGDTMKGTIRARGHCPKCGEKFKHIRKVGYLCPDCKTVPKRFVIDDLWFDGQRIRVYSNKQGQVLEGYQQAHDLLSAINQEIKDHTFDASHYIKSEQKLFWCSSLLEEMKSDRLSSIAPAM